MFLQRRDIAAHLKIGHMDDLSTLFRVLVPLLCIIPGAVLLLIGSVENIRWRVNMGSDQQLLINVLGGALVVVGLGIVLVPIFVNDRNARASIVEPTALPPVFLKISQPAGHIDCSGTEVVCAFDINGQGGGVAPPMDQYRVATFIFPLEPLGAGYYIQPGFAALQEDGSWLKSRATFGSSAIPVESGGKLRVQAALISSDASINGTRLDQLPQGFYLGRLSDIEGLLVMSESVDLTIEK